MAEQLKKKRKMPKGEITLPQGTSANLLNNELTVKGPKGEAKRQIKDKRVNIQIGNGSVIITSNKKSKKDKMAVGTFKSHIKNLIQGVNEPHTYTLKICSGHFPINVTMSNNEFIVKNLLGEKIPRKIKLMKGVIVKIEGDKVTVESPDKELAGRTAASIELLTRRTSFDTRIFQDGVYITEKAGKGQK